MGNRVQHALRAYTPAEQKKVRAAADTFRANPEFRTLDAIMELATGEALISFLGDDGAPTPVERAWILPPQSHMGSIEDSEREDALRRDGIGARYDEMVDRESAYELLAKRAEESAREYEEYLAELERQKQEEMQRIAEEKAELARQKAAEKEALAQQKAEEKEALAQQRAEEKAKAALEREKQKKSNQRVNKVQRIATTAASSATRSIISNTIRRPVSKKQGIATNALNSAFNSTVNGIGREISGSLIRGIFGTFKKR